MAKRRAAEPLVFHAPWKRLLRGLPDGPPCWVSPPRKRRMDAAAAVAEPPPEPRKRRGGGQPEGRGLDTGEPPPRAPEPGEQPDARAPRGGGDGGAGRGETGVPRRKGQALLEETWRRGLCFSQWDEETLVTWMEICLKMPEVCIAACQANMRSGSSMLMMRDS
ncbi:uncharacterized protein C9orf40-like [Erinaceus europaeus]|uniref:Uncharacterized protein C9orf40-like n=1 Tax=Erinaceus europaeus TaxID=9365 RepID=A0ABM3YJ39_ERIEU|nr:uncharacterized protein C9orf40-like [Erinaceus europaeus]